ncbi:MAG: Rrf2 family transcriptional regulator [Clostridia bacterium]|nr:Rrf2 family transcriptional regulator [Clostridia bacterium]
MLISTKGRYATRMLLDIAQNQKDGYVTMKSVAERQGISKKYLEQFTAQLAKAGLLDIRRGNQGGYRLLRDPADITLADVLSLTEGSLHAVACLEHMPNRCERCTSCMTLPAWAGLDKVVNDYLSSVTLQSLLDQAKPQTDGCGMCYAEHI